MEKKGTLILTLFYTVFFLLLIFCILTHSSASLYFALNGLNLWFTKMIPALFPFMVLSGIMVRLGLTENFSSLLYPVLGPLFGARKNVCYAIIMGFLCGFPMGARVTCDLLERNMITQKEARFLLAFCNNIGPVYFCSFVLPLLERKLVVPYLFGMYGIPLLYGVVLSHTVFREKKKAPSKAIYRTKDIYPTKAPARTESFPSLLEQIDEAILSAVHSILMLGGYMILFNLLNLLPYVACNFWSLGELPAKLCAPLLEITGGLSFLGTSLPLLSLILLSFGGLSCLAQTYSMMKGSGLSIGNYFFHKLVLTLLNGVFYLLWYLLFPGSFLC